MLTVKTHTKIPHHFEMRNFPARGSTLSLSLTPENSVNNNNSWSKFVTSMLENDLKMLTSDTF